MPAGKRRAGRRIVERAAADMGISPRELGEMYHDGDPEARVGLQAAASRDSSGVEEFAQPGERDWSAFFESFMECFEKFLPIILAL
jgi:hypothetical protein